MAVLTRHDFAMLDEYIDASLRTVKRSIVDDGSDRNETGETQEVRQKSKLLFGSKRTFNKKEKCAASLLLRLTLLPPVCLGLKKP